MKKGRKIAVLLATFLFLSACLSGCGITGEGEDAAEKETFVIGLIAPLSGDASPYGQAVENACKLAVDEINASGGVCGMELVLLAADDAHSEEQAKAAYNALKNKEVRLILGTVTGDPCKAVVKLSASDNMFQLIPTAAASELAQNDNVFRVCYSYQKQGIAAARYMHDEIGAEKPVVFAKSTDPYSAWTADAFVNESVSLGLEKPETLAFTDDDKGDFSKLAEKLNKSGADAVFMPVDTLDAALILKALADSETDLKFLGCDRLNGLIEELGEDADLADGVMYMIPYTSLADNKGVPADFTAAYKERYGKEPILHAAYGYDSVYVLKAVLEEAGIKDPDIDAALLCDKLTDAMARIEVEGATGTITFDKSGEPMRETQVVQIRDGKCKVISK